MKTALILTITIVIFFVQSQISGCNNMEKNGSGEAAVKMYFDKQTTLLMANLSMLDSLPIKASNLNVLKNQFKICRNNYKKIEAIAEYYYQGLTKRINGPALPDVKTEDGVVWPPHGFQVIEQIIYTSNADSLIGLSKEIKLLQTDLRFMQKNMEYNSISASHIKELVQHQFIRIAALGVTGFDSPIAQLSLEEAVCSLDGIQNIAALYFGKQKSDEAKNNAQQAAIKFLNNNTDFNAFNRLGFITDYLMPLSDMYAVLSGLNSAADSMMIKPFTGTLSNYMKGEGFNADYYSSYAQATTNTDKIALGKRLFFDNRLSKSGKVSCGSCHKPELFFTDGKATADNFVHGGSLPRNTPTVYYAGFQAGQFYDLRSITLEDQADQVMKSSEEFNYNSNGIAKKLLQDAAYATMFTKAFGAKADTVSGFQLRNALASYVRSLSPFSSAFDEFIKGNKLALNEKQIRGFNLFAGKAKCATCHFVPLYNGNNPPWFTKSESEIIGVPSKAVWANASIDKDSGRYKINQMQELLYAFKTPTIRNIEKTGPYMHNGVYKTLDEVVEFYHKGGGVGLGIDLPFQSLPFDSLILNKNEKEEIVSFMLSLTDKKKDY